MNTTQAVLAPSTACHGDGRPDSVASGRQTGSRFSSLVELQLEEYDFLNPPRQIRSARPVGVTDLAVLSTLRPVHARISCGYDFPKRENTLLIAGMTSPRARRYLSPAAPHCAPARPGRPGRYVRRVGDDGIVAARGRVAVEKDLANAPKVTWRRLELVTPAEGIDVDDTRTVPM